MSSSILKNEIEQYIIRGLPIIVKNKENITVFPIMFHTSISCHKMQYFHPIFCSVKTHKVFFRISKKLHKKESRGKQPRLSIWFRYFYVLLITLTPLWHGQR